MYRFFTASELECHCDKCKGKGEDHMDPVFMERLIILRERVGFALPVSSAYRCADHPAEARKEAPGAHHSGKAVDIKVSGTRAYKLVKEATDLGFVGLGISQKGLHTSRFVHLDLDFEQARPWVWSY